MIEQYPIHENLNTLPKSDHCKSAVSFPYKVYCRSFQRIMQTASYFVKWRKPLLLEGENSILILPEKIKQENIHRLLIVTDPGIVSLGLMDSLLSGLSAQGIFYAVFDQTIANPTSDTVEHALEMYKKNRCEAIIAFGGGSPMDCAKAVGARCVRPKKSIRQMRGVLKVLHKLPPLYAVPTTAGTGSETTIAAVISDPETHVKYQIDDLQLIPHLAVLDPCLTAALPGFMTSTTGMDALTHAVEAFLGRSNTKETIKMAQKAVMLIFSNLENTYRDGQNLNARMNMLKASHYAGIAFTRAYVGYIHALAHAVGGAYRIPHGLANAVILPHVLSYYGKSIEKKLAQLADWACLSSQSDSDEEKAQKFIHAIQSMNASMNIPEYLPEIKKEDIPLLASRAMQEANPLYPVPVILGQHDLEYLLYKIGNIPTSH